MSPKAAPKAKAEAKARATAEPKGKSKAGKSKSSSDAPGKRGVEEEQVEEQPLAQFSKPLDLRATTSAMLGFLKYQSNPLTNKDQDAAMAASTVFETYKSLDNSKKQKFADVR